MRERSKKRLGELLIEAGVLTKDALEQALAYQKKEGGLIGQILLSRGLITEQSLTAALAQQLKVPFLSLEVYSVNPDAMNSLEEDFCRDHHVIAFDRDEKRISLALADPLDDATIDEVEKKTSLKAQVFISTPTEVSNALDLFFSSSPKKEFKKAG